MDTGHSNPWTIPAKSRPSHQESRSSSVDLAASPGNSSPLQLLCDMFPLVDIQTIKRVFARSGQNPSVCAEMLLSLQPLSDDGSYNNFAAGIVASTSDAHQTGSDPFLHLPVDSVKIIARFLTLFDLAVFGCVNRECKRLAEKELSAVTVLNNAGGLRQASDEKILKMLARFPNLTSVSLYKCCGFRCFSLLPVALRGANITSLNLAFCENIADVDVRVLLVGFPSLQHLDLSGTSITDEALETISVMAAETLRRLILSMVKSISDFGINFIHTRCTALQQLDLRGTHISPGALEISPNGARLTALYMSACKRVSRIVLLQDFSMLKTLVLSSNLNMLEATLSLPHLNLLNMSSSKQLSRLSLDAPELIIMNLSGCSGLLHAGFTPSALQRINLYNCRSLSSASIASLILANREFLRDIDIRGCPQLMDTDAVLFAQQCPIIQRFDVTGCKSLSAHAISQVNRAIASSLERSRLLEERPPSR
uniref:CUE domain-containing protein n=1 Tax=Spongospora subterranea TaxID=70186 RepID=A0A0H5RE21_9EUKA|eukprot:CRZ11782.1 hypothetical protein [Spongospora subterranea]